MKKKRNPPDSTTRNIRAANKRIAELRKRVTTLEGVHGHCINRIFRELESIRSFHDITSADMRKRITALESNMKKARRGRCHG